MTKPKDIAALVPGEEVSISITVRGSDMTEARGTALAAPTLDNWQRSTAAYLSDGLEFTAADAFEPKPQGEFSVRRTLTVRSKA